MCTFYFILHRKNMFSFNIAKWVCDIADCCFITMQGVCHEEEKVNRVKKVEKGSDVFVFLYRLFMCGKNS